MLFRNAWALNDVLATALGPRVYKSHRFLGLSVYYLEDE